MDNPTGSTKPAGTRRWLRIAASAALAAAVVTIVGTVVRLPAYSVGPGPARNVGDLVKVIGRERNPGSGRFLLTTVAVSSRTLTPFEAIRAWLDPTISVVDRGAIISPGLDQSGQDQLNRLDMEMSKLAATVVGLRATGLTPTEIPGARVLTVIPDSPAAGVIEVGDLIVSVNGTNVRAPGDAVAVLRGVGVGDEVLIGLERAGRPILVTVRTDASLTDPGRASAGVGVGPAYRLPLAIEIESFQIGGPSGGLVFALAVLDALAPEDLTCGHEIAATGTIALDGSVGLVGGIREKSLAAARAGATVFVVPADEVSESRESFPGRVIGVRTLEEAAEALRDLARQSDRGEVCLRPAA